MVRFAKREDLERINEIRKMVHEVHARGRADLFKAEFGDDLRNYIYDIWNAEDKDILAAERNGVICGFACVQYVDKSENPVMNGRKFYKVEEFGVDEKFRRQKVAAEMMEFIREEAKRLGMNRVELDMWEFNKSALAFYEAAGFKTYRRYMELECV